jgi:hypothetical protein
MDKLMDPTQVRKHITKTLIGTINSKLLCSPELKKPHWTVPILEHERFAVDGIITYLKYIGWQVDRNIITKNKSGESLGYCGDTNDCVQDVLEISLK